MQNFDPEEGVRSVHEAFKLGVNVFDTSPYYGSGRSEEVSRLGVLTLACTCFSYQVLGRALKDLPRSEIVVATKVGRYGVDEFDFSAETVTESIHKSLERLQTDVIDLIQCHDIEFVHLDQVISF